MSPSMRERFLTAIAPLRLLVSALATAIFIVLNVADVPIKGMESVNWLWAALVSFLIFVWLVYTRLLSFPAHLQIVYSPEHPMQWPEQGWYRIKVENRSSWTQAQNVRARIESIVPNPLPFNAVPSDMGVKDGDSHDVNPGGYVLFDVVQDVPHEDRKLRIFLIGSMGQEFSLEPDQSYEIFVRVTAANAEPRDQSFILTHPLGAPLEFSLKEGHDV